MKLRSKKGFTLMEMLIVVGIIAVLVAVSIPVFTTQLEKAREAADIANLRSAKAAGVTYYLTEDKTGEFGYNTKEGKLVSFTNADECGKGTAASGGMTYENYSGTDVSGKKIKVTISTDGTVKAEFA